jgi:hypothetical protein
MHTANANDAQYHPVDCSWLDRLLLRSMRTETRIDRDGRTVYSKPVGNDESALRLLVLWAPAHQAAVAVDQPGGTAALLLKLCWDATIEIGYVPGLAMARARDFYAGDSKIDLKDTFVLADLGRAHPNRVVCYAKRVLLAPSWSS